MPDTTPIVDITGVFDTLARLSDAWNAGDAAAYGAEFTADATYVAFNGQVMDGRAAIEDTHRRLFDGPLRGSRMTQLGNDAVPATVRLLRPDVAHVVITGAVVPPGQGTVTADRESVLSFVLTDDGDGWRVAAFHNTRRHDPAAAGRWPGLPEGTGRALLWHDRGSGAVLQPTGWWIAEAIRMESDMRPVPHRGKARRELLIRAAFDAALPLPYQE